MRSYRGNGIEKLSKTFIDSDSDDEQIGGFFDIGSLLSNMGKFVSENKDVIQSVASTAGKVVDMGKSVSDTVKSFKLTSDNKKRQFTPEEDKKLQGSGFVKFSKN